MSRNVEIIPPGHMRIQERTPPHNYEAEQALLGAILANNGVYSRVVGFLQPGMFADALHARIYEACGKLIDKGTIANPVTLKTLFDQDGALAEIGGAEYLVKLAGAIVTIINAEDYGRAVRDHYLARQLIDLGETIVNSAYAYNPDQSSEAKIQEAERQLYELGNAGATRETQGMTMHAAAAAMLAKAKDAGQLGYVPGAITSGLIDVDKIVRHVVPQDLCIIGGRPSMGKSALAQGILRHNAKNGFKSLMFSLEMSEEQIAAREISAMTGFGSSSIMSGAMAGDMEWPSIDAAAAELAGLPITIDATPGLTPNEMLRRARHHKLRFGLDVIVVDHIHLMNADGRHDNRVGALTSISRGLKAMAKALDVPVVALAQLSRAVETRDDKRPMLSDLRESGSIEQDADQVLFVFREQYYLERAEPSASDASKYADWQAEMDRAQGVGEIIVAKNRHGPAGGIARVQWDGTRTRFGNLYQHRG
jgi:replicative DNA helicase